MGSNDYHNGIISKDIAKRTCLDPLSYLEDIQHEEAKQVPKKRRLSKKPKKQNPV
ncbi:hypothetical protein NWE55_11855 [Myroides albus]|uniref:hypothetical protein n=1 Tax=Myroides albus TaxID=2562892 RepID=UPI0013275E99|nr:hypothetical protein [Myroides albus]MVX35239.1 hypothetical protein [Myroides sp. LoEW2-1]UVD78811.1 hypothetical protein NWE55_11855 [Myroides albus]